jgi:hypothetical protein
MTGVAAQPRIDAFAHAPARPCYVGERLVAAVS